MSEASMTPPTQQPPAGRIVSLVRRQPLVWFFVLAYALSWPLILAGGLNPLAPPAAALIVLSLTQGRSGVKLLLRRAVKWRVPARWYAAALLLPPLFILAAVALTVATGAPMPTPEQLADWPGLIITFVVILLIGGGLEEVGWRGYGQAQLQERHSALATATILAVLIAGWHLPLFLDGSLPPQILIGLFSTQILFGWIFNSTGGSALLAVLAHTMHNTVSGEFFGPMFTGADSDRFSWFLGLTYGVGALCIVLFAGPAHLARGRHKVLLSDAGPNVRAANSDTASA
jgi:uncharacterized protein